MTRTRTVPKANTSSKIVFSAKLISNNQDTNDYTRRYAWADQGRDQMMLSYLNDGLALEVLESGLYVVAASIRVINATANERASFVVMANVGERSYQGTSAYVRDDQASFDKAQAAISVTTYIAAGEQISIAHQRLYSQDPTDDNPADQSTSTLLIERIFI